MTTRIDKDFFFQAAVHLNGNFYVNTYEATASMLVETASVREQSIALERINHFLESILQNSLLIHDAETASIKKYKKAGIKICELPQEPVDQIIAMVILQKLNAIMENRIVITDMTMGSLMSEGIRYHIVAEVSENVMSGDHWWNRPCIGICKEHVSVKKRDNVVKLFDDNSWTELGLAWKEKNIQIN
jgi:hypothetical protein